MTQIIYGRHPVLAALRQADSNLEEVVIAQGLQGQWLGEVRRRSRAAGVRLRELERPALDQIAGTKNHQGIVAWREAFAYRSETELLDHLPTLPSPPLLVAADGLTDPMNLGNLSRSALAAGVQGLIIPRERAAGVTPAVLKAAAGALEFLPLYRVTNMADCLRRLKDAGLVIIGTDARTDNSIYEADLTVLLVLVVGSEDKGLRPRVRQQCDLVLAIPMARPEIGSLNAATAAAVALFEIRRQRLQPKKG